MKEQIARGIITHEGKVLLCKNLKYGYYFLPGGHIEENESPEVALKREIVEEVGKKVRSLQKTGEFENTFVQENKQRCEKVFVYRTELEDYENIASLEPHIAFVWFTGDELKDVDLRPMQTKNIVASQSFY